MEDLALRSLLWKLRLRSEELRPEQQSGGRSKRALVPDRVERHVALRVTARFQLEQRVRVVQFGSVAEGEPAATAPRAPPHGTFEEREESCPVSGTYEVDAAGRARWECDVIRYSVLTHEQSHFGEHVSPFENDPTMPALHLQRLNAQLAAAPFLTDEPSVRAVTRALGYTSDAIERTCWNANGALALSRKRASVGAWLLHEEVHVRAVPVLRFVQADGLQTAGSPVRFPSRGTWAVGSIWDDASLFATMPGLGFFALGLTMFNAVWLSLLATVTHWWEPVAAAVVTTAAGVRAWRQAESRRGKAIAVLSPPGESTPFIPLVSAIGSHCGALEVMDQATAGRITEVLEGPGVREQSAAVELKLADGTELVLLEIPNADQLPDSVLRLLGQETCVVCCLDVPSDQRGELKARLRSAGVKRIVSLDADSLERWRQAWLPRGSSDEDWNRVWESLWGPIREVLPRRRVRPRAGVTPAAQHQK